MQKGVKELWRAFASLHEEERADWELWCLGKGELEDQIPCHPAIYKFGFVQPKELTPYLEKTGVFILPARYEHWGVVVHEFAAAGFPLICSLTTSAASVFLKNGENGYYTKPGSEHSIRDALRRVIALPDEKLWEMAEKSMTLATKITPLTWSATLWNLINQK